VLLHSETLSTVHPAAPTCVSYERLLQACSAEDADGRPYGLPTILSLEVGCWLFSVALLVSTAGRLLEGSPATHVCQREA
jgi:hypothetical protein